MENEQTFEKKVEEKVEGWASKCGKGCGCGKKCGSSMTCAGGSSCLYGMGFIAAAFYYITTTTGFSAGAVGVLKALIWPGILVYEAFKLLGI